MDFILSNYETSKNHAEILTMNFGARKLDHGLYGMIRIYTDKNLKNQCKSV